MEERWHQSPFAVCAGLACLVLAIGLAIASVQCAVRIGTPPTVAPVHEEGGP